MSRCGLFTTQKFKVEGSRNLDFRVVRCVWCRRSSENASEKIMHLVKTGTLEEKIVVTPLKHPPKFHPVDCKHLPASLCRTS